MRHYRDDKQLLIEAGLFFDSEKNEVKPFHVHDSSAQMNKLLESYNPALFDFIRNRIAIRNLEKYPNRPPYTGTLLHATKLMGNGASKFRYVSRRKLFPDGRHIASLADVRCAGRRPKFDLYLGKSPSSFIPFADTLFQSLIIGSLGMPLRTWHG